MTDTSRSPRGSQLPSPTPSARSSLSLDRSSLPRRNRAALRDYYKLAPFSAPSVASPPPPSSSSLPTAVATSDPSPSPLDLPTFSAQSHIDALLASSPLAGVLRAEALLVSEMRALDGERKALVYDNYAKLIAATDTMRAMREGMAPLAPVTRRLEPAVEGVARVVEELARDGSGGGGGRTEASDSGRTERGEDERERRATVRWVVEAPARAEALLAQGKRQEAETEWEAVEQSLERWKGVEGVEDVRKRGSEILGRKV